jgi:hypothetical protein
MLSNSNVSGTEESSPKLKRYQGGTPRKGESQHESAKGVIHQEKNQGLLFYFSFSLESLIIPLEF